MSKSQSKSHMHYRQDQDLSALWEKAIKDGKIAIRFTDHSGRSIESGLRIEGDSIEYYVKELGSGHDLDAQVEEDFIYGSKSIIQINQPRALKPQSRLPNSGPQPDISPDVRDCRFFCQNPGNPLSLLARDAVFRASLPNSEWLAFPNAVPFEKEGHLLFVPSRTAGALTILPHCPQIFTRELVEDFLALSKGAKNTIIFFNPLHGGASVNHIHFQWVYHKGRLAIEDADRTVVGQHTFLSGYSVNGLVFDGKVTCDPIWSCVEKLQNRGFPSNLIALGDSIYLIPRNVEHEIVEEFPAAVMASMEIAGKFITADRDLYERARQGRLDLNSALRKTTLSADVIMAALAADCA